MKKLLPLILVVFFGCSSVPLIYDTNPAKHMGDDINVEFRIGKYVYYIRVENKTSEPVYIDDHSMTITSIYGDARYLFPWKSELPFPNETSVIPPNSTITYETYRSTFFESDIDSKFVKKSLFESIDKDEDITYLADYPEKEFLSSFIGSTVYLFIPYTTSNEYRFEYFPVMFSDIKDAE